MDRRHRDRRGGVERDPDLVARFQRRRKISLYGGFLPAICSILAMGIFLGSECESVWGMTAYVLCTIGIVIFMVGIPLWALCFRCPSCGRIPAPPGLSDGLPMDPDHCPHCGTILR